MVVLGHSRKPVRCPRCGRTVKTVEDEHVRVVRDLDVGEMRCYVQYSVRKMRCGCGFRGFERPGFVREYSRCTRRFEEWVGRLCPVMTIKDVSILVGLDWKAVKGIDKKKNA